MSIVSTGIDSTKNFIYLLSSAKMLISNLNNLTIFLKNINNFGETMKINDIQLK